MKLSLAERLALVGLALFYYLFGLGAYGLLNDNEGLYAETARELLRGGSAIVPHLNGVPYLEKPPLLTWLLAGAYGAFGRSAFVSRLIPAVAGLVLVAATFVFVRRIRDELTAWTAALVLATSLPMVMVLRSVMPDGLLICLFSAAMYLFYLWHASGRRRFLLFAYALLGGAVLAKGFLALALAGLTFLAFGALRPRRWRYRDLFHPAALLAFLAVAAPWHLVLAWMHPAFAWDYVFNEQVLRFLGARKPDDYYSGPLYYYLPRIVLALLPWSLFLPLLAVRRRGVTPRGDGFEWFLWTWFLVALVFFSVSRAKANYYMLIGSPPLAILLAQPLAALAEGRRRWLLVALTGSITVAAAIAAYVAAGGNWMHHPTPFWITAFRLHRAMVLALAGVAALGLVAALGFALGHGRAGLAVLGLSFAPLLAFFLVLAQRAEPYVSERDLATYLERRLPGREVFLYRDFERLSSLPFYLGHSVPVVDSASADLQYGSRHSSRSGLFLSDARFAALCRRERVVLLVEKARVPGFEARLGGLGLRVTAKIGDVSVLTN